MSADATQSLGSAQVFARGWRLWWQNAGPLALASLVVSVPMQALNIAVIYFTQPRLIEQIESYPEMVAWIERLSTDPGAQPPPELLYVPQGPEYALLMLGQLLTLAIAIIGAALLLSIAVEIGLESAAGRRLGWRDALEAAVGRLPSMALLTLIWGAAVIGTIMVASFVAAFPVAIAGIAGSAVALIITVPLAVFIMLAPAIWLAVVWAVPVPALIVEGARNFTALGRSFRLVRGHFWTTTGAFVLLTLVQMAIGALLVAPAAVALISGDGIGAVTIALWIAGGIVGGAIYYPLLGTLLASIYLDLRRREQLRPSTSPTALPPDPERPAGAV